MSTVLCPSCGRENPAGFQFCGFCTAPLAAPEPRREERKVVTVLFCDLVGFTQRSEAMDPEDVRGLLRGYHERLRRELERFGGTVEKFIGDAVMAVFGAPVAHEDDPERALRAAIAIRDWTAERDDLQVRIGIATGEALVTLGAHVGESEVMVAGDVVNTAARVQVAAPVNGILVSEETYRATRDVIDYRDVEPVHAKGKAEPLPVWEAAEARSRLGVDVQQQGRAPLVGRDRELAALVDALARARSEREPQLVTLLGVPGIGKSRLVYELFQRVEAEAELVYWRQGRSLPYGDGVTFGALAGMVKAHAGVLETDAAADAEQKLARAVSHVIDDDSQAEWVTAHLRPLLGLGGATELSSDRRSEAFAAWRTFFEALAERSPLVMVFEDLQWADDGLLDFVDYLVEWASAVPLLVLATARPELIARRPDWGGGKVNAATVLVSPLSQEHTALLVHALLERSVLPADVQAALLDRAGGNPLYAEEFARMFEERGLSGGDGDLPLPTSLQGIVAARLDALPTDAKALLQDAAVLGKVFWVAALVSIGSRDRAAVDEQLHALERREFIRRERRTSVAGETEYAFRHALVRDVAYAQIPRARRAEKHRLTAGWIESLAPDRSEDRSEMLAHHYLSALDYARAAGQDVAELAAPARHALREAGDRALRLHAHRAAARFYSAALELSAPDDGGRPRLLLNLGRALIWSDETGEEQLADACDAALAQGDAETAAEAEASLTLLAWRRGDHERTLRHLERSLALVGNAPPSPAKAVVLNTAAAQLMVSEENERAIAVARDALAIAERFSMDEVRMNALTTIGSARANAGDPSGFADFEHALEVADAAAIPPARIYINMASSAAVCGDLRRSAELLSAARETAERFGLVARLRWIRAEEAVASYYAGRWDEAVELADGFIAEAEGGSPHYMEVACRWARGLIRLARDDIAGALADATQAVHRGRVSRDPQNLYPALEFHARVLLAQGRKQDAEPLADELLAFWSDAKGPFTGYDQLAWILLWLGREGDLLSLIDRSTVDVAWIDAARAVCRREFARAADVCVQIGTRPDEAYARLRAAEQLSADGRRAEADAQLQQALAFYRSVGATRYIRNAESLLAASA